MYRVGDHIVYGQNGVCEVVDISERNFPGTDLKREYYTLQPLYQTGTVYVPVDIDKPMRRAISAVQADMLIDSIPYIRVNGSVNEDMNQRAARYRILMDTQACEDLLELVLLIYAKKVYSEENKKKLGQIDQKFMKNAEELLHGELAAALNIRKEDVREYIRRRISSAESLQGFHQADMEYTGRCPISAVKQKHLQ